VGAVALGAVLLVLGFALPAQAASVRILGGIPNAGEPMGVPGTLYEDYRPYKVQDDLPSIDVELWVVRDSGLGSTVPGDVCKTGDGDETCGFEVVLEAADDMQIIGFQATGTNIVFAPTSFATPVTSLAISGYDIASAAAQTRIGIVTLNTEGETAAGVLSVVSGQRVAAELTLEPINTHNVVEADVFRVPEPAELVLLGSGIVALMGFGWLRRTSA
jgi:hypothetical protein